jgi:Arc/MetJ-type ribon-helix-helix transcriptional regulator
MRTLVDIPEEQIEALDRLSRAERKSRAAIIRAAVADYLKERDQAERKAAIEAGFGLWKDLGIDGLEYQERIRAEWDRDPSA